ncbi:MAG: creatininase family protein [Planctomycetes bacterium]|nr:creatininase family protein [Planctomycetota bacterium]
MTQQHSSVSNSEGRAPKGVVLADLTWLQAEKLFDENTVVVIPIGAEAKEHGPHLLLKNDLLIAEYFAGRLVAESEIVLAPTLNYNYYPAFTEYPGSTTLRLETARDLMVDICTSLARHGPRRFYALNTGVSTNRALEPAVEILACQGIHLGFTDLRSFEKLEQGVGEQEGGTHADEIETSMMLIIAPWSVDMSKAVCDYNPRPGGGLTRFEDRPGSYSPSGVFGDATLASVEKGEVVVEAYVGQLLKDVEAVRTAVLPG